MWIFKLILLLALIASWIPGAKSQDQDSRSYVTNSEPEPEPDEEEDNEELAA